MEKYIDERVTIINSINKKYKNLLESSTSKKMNNYSLNKMYLINKNLDIILSDIEELETDFEIKYTKKEDKELLNKINEIEKYNENIKKIYPYMLMLNVIPSDKKVISCDECNKKFFGKDYLRRYRQHFKAKHCTNMI
tara:strand:+ start:63 stop:476 length:414 start_codon:yes stop_codon:yes gene_type:complete